MTIQVVPVYAAILALMFVGLSFRTIGLRRNLKVLLGNGEEQLLARAIRVHGNFAEYIPLAIVLMLMLELKAPGFWLHVAGIVLIVGRAVHAFGVSQEPENVRFRVIGMFSTLFVIISVSLRLIFS